MTALHGTGVPVPKTYALCTDDNVIGTWFYIMDHVEGRIIWDNDMPDSNPEERAAVYTAMVETLAKLHAVDHVAIGLDTYGKPTDYIARTLNRFRGQYQLPETEKIPEMDWLAEWLPAHIPPEEPAGIVHGDFKLANLVLHPTEPEVIAILDWELSTIGNPIADLAVHCLPYYPGLDPRGPLTDLDLPSLGIPSEAELLAAYCRATGRDSAPHWNYIMAAYALLEPVEIARISAPKKARPPVPRLLTWANGHGRSPRRPMRLPVVSIVNTYSNLRWPFHFESRNLLPLGNICGAGRVPNHQ